jgi:hypothetical protein
MRVFCVLGIEYLYGNSIISIPKIYSVYDSFEKAIKEKNRLTFDGIENLSVNSMEVN